jgi:hypothetical protein
MNSSITHNNSSAEGGGVSNGAIGTPGTATMTIQNSTISDNLGVFGGGVHNVGIMSIINSTIANNRAVLLDGGGINNPRGLLTITNSTISGNSTPGTLGDTGGIVNGGTVILQNTILGLNSGSDCSGPITSLGNNIIGDLNSCDISLLSSDLTGDPGLGAFVDEGTPGRGHFPLNPGSQAVDAGNAGACLQADQLGLLRIGICDIGAVEFRGPMLVSVDVRPRSDANRINPNSTGNINVAILSANGFDATTVNANTVRFGATGIEAVPIRTVLNDVNGDGHSTWSCVFKFRILELAAGILRLS